MQQHTHWPRFIRSDRGQEAIQSVAVLAVAATVLIGLLRVGRLVNEQGREKIGVVLAASGSTGSATTAHHSWNAAASRTRTSDEPGTSSPRPGEPPLDPKLKTESGASPTEDSDAGEVDDSDNEDPEKDDTVAEDPDEDPASKKPVARKPAKKKATNSPVSSAIPDESSSDVGRTTAASGLTNGSGGMAGGSGQSGNFGGSAGGSSGGGGFSGGGSAGGGGGFPGGGSSGGGGFPGGSGGMGFPNSGFGNQSALPPYGQNGAGYPNNGYPGNGYPNAGYPGTGYPGNGYPGSGLGYGTPLQIPGYEEFQNAAEGKVKSSEDSIASAPDTAPKTTPERAKAADTSDTTSSIGNSVAADIVDEINGPDPDDEEDLPGMRDASIDEINVIGIDRTEPAITRLKIEVGQEFDQIQVRIGRRLLAFKSPLAGSVSHIPLRATLVEPGSEIIVIGIEGTEQLVVHYDVPQPDMPQTEMAATQNEPEAPKFEEE